MEYADGIAFVITITMPFIIVFYFIRRWFDMKAKKLEIDAVTTAEKAAEYATRNSELEQRVRVLEQIVTDGGAETAAQIEALRSLPSDKREMTA